MNYCPFVEYYRRQCAPRPEAINLPGVGGGWRATRGPLGACYVQDGTGYLLPAGLVERYLSAQRLQRDLMLAGVPS